VAWLQKHHTDVEAAAVQPAATWLLCGRGAGSVPAKLQRRIDKFCESLWKV
jgi:hypothetical protein